MTATLAPPCAPPDDGDNRGPGFYCPNCGARYVLAAQLRNHFHLRPECHKFAAMLEHWARHTLTPSGRIGRYS